MTNEILKQYISLQSETRELRQKIEYLESGIEKLHECISRIEAGETVKDKVYGGEGGCQGYVIEGIPIKEYRDKKNELTIKKMVLEERKEMLNMLELDSMWHVNEIEKFINSIKDSQIRRIFRLRIVEGFTWNQVANIIGGGNTEDSVRKIYTRFLETHRLSDMSA